MPLASRALLQAGTRQPALSQLNVIYPFYVALIGRTLENFDRCGAAMINLSNDVRVGVFIWPLFQTYHAYP